MVGGWITSLIPDFATESKASTIENTKIDVAVDVIADSSIYDNSAIYFGIDFRGFSFTTVTGPMDFDTAVLWALAGGLPGINKFGGYVGWDYYVPIKSGKFAGKIE